MEQVVSITAVVPLYNKSGSVERCLTSILNQSVPVSEIIVIDDGSSDGGDDIARRVLGARGTVIRQENAGPGAARNRGLDLASHPWVAFLDADDEWLPGFVERAVRAIEDSTEELVAVCCGLERGVTEKGSFCRRCMHMGETLPPRAIHPRRETDLRELIDLVAFMTPCATVVSREAARSVGGFYEQDRCVYGEDDWLWLHLALAGPVLPIREVLVRVHEDASTLHGGGVLTAPTAVEPFLQEDQQPRLGYQGAKGRLVELYLAYRAARTSVRLIENGQRMRARQLLRCWCPPSKWVPAILGLCLHAWLLASPVAPFYAVQHRLRKALGRRLRYWFVGRSGV